mmetsp:Transcript_30846/g.71250  ORF Transcript_30846/g.71250 Transcript_30846/m.71250 type:complete len:288 (-) Transcript_30846:237-1100(-)
MKADFVSAPASSPEECRKPLKSLSQLTSRRLSLDDLSEIDFQEARDLLEARDSVKSELKTTVDEGKVTEATSIVATFAQSHSASSIFSAPEFSKVARDSLKSGLRSLDEGKATESASTAASTSQTRSTSFNFSLYKSEISKVSQASCISDAVRAEKAWLRRRLRKVRRQDLLSQFLTKHGLRAEGGHQQNAFGCFGLWTKPQEHPIHVAARVGNTVIVQILLEEGADPNQRTSGGRTPREIALAQDYLGSHLGVLELLEERPRAVDMRTAMKLMVTDNTRSAVCEEG